VDGRTLTLAASGWLYSLTFVLFDYETESIWFPRARSTGYLTCVSGAFADSTLKEYPSTRIPWNEWKILHPDSKYMPRE
jgi:hypothetical protein